jgi:hypothetical protein
LFDTQIPPSCRDTCRTGYPGEVAANTSSKAQMIASKPVTAAVAPRRDAMRLLNTGPIMHHSYDTRHCAVVDQ